MIDHRVYFYISDRRLRTKRLFIVYTAKTSVGQTRVHESIGRFRTKTILHALIKGGSLIYETRRIVTKQWLKKRVKNIKNWPRD